MANKNKKGKTEKRGEKQLESSERNKLLNYAQEYVIFVDETAMLSGYFLDFWNRCVEVIDRQKNKIYTLETWMRYMKKKVDDKPRALEKEYCKVVSALYEDHCANEPEDRLFIVKKERNGMQDLREYKDKYGYDILLIVQDEGRIRQIQQRFNKEDEKPMRIAKLTQNGYLEEIVTSEEDEVAMFAASSKNELDNSDRDEQSLSQSWTKGI